MSELDVEKLQWLAQVEATEFNPLARRQLIEAMPAIIAALEDRDRLRAVVSDIANEPEVDGRCPECVLDGYHEDWCSRGKCIVALEGHDG